ncbi:phosphatase PAP2 family protein [Actinoplanes sp. NBC_00393]|uniref:phosphatase PAP2 family protein n=1 Tax=Actinoplanes sp. NBC_00393 TaxID=2975953 RepID=UPI002E1DC2A1
MTGTVPGRDPRRRWWILVAVGVTGLVGAYAGFVLTATGQALENAALRGADQVADWNLAESDEALAHITVASLAVACTVIAVVGLLRRSVPLAVAAVGTVVAGQVVTQGLKTFILPRPALVEASEAYTGNSFPSGHTAIALTVLAATLMLATWRVRGVALFFVASSAVAIAGYTLQSKWHRLSDTLGSAAVTLIVASLASLWLHRRGLVRTVTTGGHRARIVLVAAPLAIGTVVSAALGVLLLVASDDVLGADPVIEYNVYLALQSLAAAGSGATALALWWSWHRIEVVTHADGAAPQRPDRSTSAAAAAEDAQEEQEDVEDVEEDRRR